MAHRNNVQQSDLLDDPFRERLPATRREHLQLLGARFEFESNSRQLLELADSAYAGLPEHRFTGPPPRLKVRLELLSRRRPRTQAEPPLLGMLSGAGFLCGATDASNCVVVSPAERAALVVVSQDMLRFPYHTRFELIEFAVYTLAARVQKLVSLHAACVASKGRGALLIGASGSGKSTVALHCLLRGFDFLSEDSAFVAPHGMLATGIPNFLHVRPNCLRFLARTADAAMIRKSPVIRRRSGVEKFEVDLRRPAYRLAAAPLKLHALIFLSRDSAGSGPLFVPLRKSKLLANLRASQPYAANQPEWAAFERGAACLNAFELRRGRHPRAAVDALQELLGSRAR
jgi:hypothetical protein